MKGYRELENPGVLTLGWTFYSSFAKRIVVYPEIPWTKCLLTLEIHLATKCLTVIRTSQASTEAQPCTFISKPLNSRLGNRKRPDPLEGEER